MPNCKSYSTQTDFQVVRDKIAPQIGKEAP